jgi:hypothetical protein
MEIYMYKLNKITRIMGTSLTLAGGVALSLFSSSNAYAESVTTATATVIVQNAFSLVESTPINFGTVRAVADPLGGTNFASLILAPAGTTTVADAGNSAMTALSPATAGLFTITGAAAFTDLTVTFPADFELITSGAPGTAPNFSILQANWTGTVVGGANDGTTGGTPVPQTDLNGDVALQVGTTLTTDVNASSSPYLDATYAATYTMDISY